jgi:hypothetical protein
MEDAMPLSLDDMPAYSAQGIKGAPIKRMGTAIYILDMGQDDAGMPQELRIQVDPAVLDTHDAPVIGDFYVTGPNGACVVRQQIFYALFSSEQLQQVGQQPQPESGPVPEDALGLTSQSLEVTQGQEVPTGGLVTEAQPQDDTQAGGAAEPGGGEQGPKADLAAAHEGEEADKLEE